MDITHNSSTAVNTRRKSLLRTIIMLLVGEKIIQHIFVTLAFYFNWNNIHARVVIKPTVLMVLGVILTILFAISLWGLIKYRSWASGLLIFLALFDIIGEFVAQGTIAIVITVSFVVAFILLILTLLFRRQNLK